MKAVNQWRGRCIALVMQFAGCCLRLRARHCVDILQRMSMFFVAEVKGAGSDTESPAEYREHC